MERPVNVKGQKVGDVDQGRDRPQPDRLQPAAQPGRARPVADAADMPPEKQGAGRAVLDLDRDRRAEAAGNRGRVERLQTPDPGGGKVARDPAHAEAIGAVRRHLDVEDRVADADQIGVARSDRRVLGQLDDPVAVVAEAQLIGRAQHAARDDAADRGFLQHRAGARDDCAGRGEDALHAGARVGRAADHLRLPRPGVDNAEPEPVGVRMGLGRDHMGDGERLEPLGAVLDPVDIVAEHDQPLDDQGERGVGVEMGLEPGEGGFHAFVPGAAELPLAPTLSPLAGRGRSPPASAPRTRDGMSSGGKP